MQNNGGAFVAVDCGAGDIDELRPAICSDP